MTGKSISGSTNTYVNLTTITHPTQAQTRYTYEVDKSNLGEDGLTEVYRLASRLDDCGGTVSNELDYTYSDCDNSGYPSYRNPDSLPASFTYFATVTNAEGQTVKSVFNSEHVNTTVTVSDGTQTLRETCYEYNDDKLPIKTTQRYYGADGEEYQETVTAAKYDASGNVTAQWSSMAEGDTANTEYKITYTYDAAYGHLLSKTYKMDGDTTVKIKNDLSEDKKSVIRTRVYVNGTVTQWTYYAYDSYGNVTMEKQFYNDLSVRDEYVLTRYTYQNGAYLTMETHSGLLTADGAAAASTPGKNAGIVAICHTYDSMGRRTSTTDGGGNTTAYTYDAAGNVTSVTNPDGTSVTYDRDYAANTVTVTDENGAEVIYTHTPLGQEYETVDGESGLVFSRREYDALGRLTTVTDFVYGAETKYKYDVLNRVTSETVYDGTTVLARNLYAYDDAAEGGQYRKVTKTVVGDTDAASIITTQYTDANGNVAMTGRMLDGVEYLDINTFDYMGNVVEQLSAADAEKGLEYTAKYKYNENNQVVKTYNAEGSYTTSTYDALGQLTQTTDYAGTPTTYTYDELGRLLTQTITISSSATATTKYEYDASGNLIAEYKPTNAVGSTETWVKTEYAYDSRQRLTTVTRYNGSTAASVTSYTYDGVGNTLTMTTGAGSDTTYSCI